MLLPAAAAAAAVLVQHAPAGLGVVGPTAAAVVHAVTRRTADRNREEEREAGPSATAATAGNSADGLTGSYWRQPDLSSPTAIRAQRRAARRRAAEASRTVAAAADSSSWAETDGFTFDDEDYAADEDSTEEEIPEPESAEESAEASIAPLASTSASEDADDLAPPAPVQLDLALPSVEQSVEQPTASSAVIACAASADALLPASASASEEKKQDDDDGDDDDEKESPKAASVEESGQFPQSKTPRPADDDGAAGTELVTAMAVASASASAGGMTRNTTTADESLQAPTSSGAGASTLSAEATAVETLKPTAVKSVKPTLKISIPDANADSGSGGAMDVVASSSVSSKDDGGDDSYDSSYKSVDAKPAAIAMKEGDDEDDVDDVVDVLSVGSITSAGTGATSNNGAVGTAPSGMTVDASITTTTTTTISGTNVNGADVNVEDATNVNGTTDASPALLAHVLETKLHLNDEGAPPPANGMGGIVEGEAEAVVEQPNHPIEAEAEQQPVVLEEDPAPAVVPVPPEAEVQPEAVPVVEEAPVPPVAAPVAEAEEAEPAPAAPVPTYLERLPADKDIPTIQTLSFDLGVNNEFENFPFTDERRQTQFDNWQAKINTTTESGKRILLIDMSNVSMSREDLDFFRPLIDQVLAMGPISFRAQSILSGVSSDEEGHALYQGLSDRFGAALLYRLTFSHNAVGTSSMPFIVNCLVNPNVREIDVDDTGMSAEAMDMFIDALRTTDIARFISLIFGKGNAGAAGGEAIATILPRSTNLEDLSVAGLRTKEGTPAFLASILTMARNRPDGKTLLVELDFTDISVRHTNDDDDSSDEDNDEGCTGLDSGFSHNGDDDFIDDDSDAVQPYDCTADLFSIVEESPNLKSLVLGDIGMRGFDLPLLLQALGNAGATLETFDLSFLRMGPVGAQLLVNHILGHLTTTLKKLNIEHCRIRNEGFAALLPALAQCPNLRVLNIAGNGLTTEGLQALVDNPLPGLTELLVGGEMTDTEEGVFANLEAAHPDAEVTEVL